MTRTRWIIFALICIGIFGVVVFMNKQNTAKFTGDASKIINDGPIKDHVLGSSEQKVVLIEYGDYQCPACERISPTVKGLTEKYGDQLTFIFRHFPLTNIHSNALAASTAAEAAGLQGKYYEMHDVLYDNQGNWVAANAADRTNYFETYAQRLGVNLSQFKNDMKNKDITAKINRDRQTGTDAYKIDATPTFILNGQKLPVDVGTSPDKLQKAVEDALKKAGYKI